MLARYIPDAGTSEQAPLYLNLTNVITMENFTRATLGRYLQLLARPWYMKVFLLALAGYFMFRFGNSVGEFLYYITH